MPNITLESNDGKTFVVDVEVAKKFKIIQNMFDDLGFEEDEEEVIPLPNVYSTVLEKVIEWVTHHKDDPAVVEDKDNLEKRTDDISQWDMDFLKVDQALLLDIAVASNYLDIPGLYAVACKTVANMIKGKTTQELRDLFNIKNDFTPEEEEQIRRENMWCEENI